MTAKEGNYEKKRQTRDGDTREGGKREVRKKKKQRTEPQLSKNRLLLAFFEIQEKRRRNVENK